MNTHTFNTTQQIKHNTPLHPLILTIRDLETREASFKTKRIAHAWEAGDDVLGDLVVEVNYACDEGREVFLTVDEVGFVEGGDGGF